MHRAEGACHDTAPATRQHLTPRQRGDERDGTLRDLQPQGFP